MLHLRAIWLYYFSDFIQVKFLLEHWHYIILLFLIIKKGAPWNKESPIWQHCWEDVSSCAIRWHNPFTYIPIRYRKIVWGILYGFLQNHLSRENDPTGGHWKELRLLTGFFSFPRSTAFLNDDAIIIILFVLSILFKIISALSAVSLIYFFLCFLMYRHMSQIIIIIQLIPIRVVDSFKQYHSHRHEGILLE